MNVTTYSQIKCLNVQNKEMKQKFDNVWNICDNNVSKNWAAVGLLEGINLNLDLKPGAEIPDKKLGYKHDEISREHWNKQGSLLLKVGFIKPSRSNYAVPHVLCSILFLL